VTAQHQVLLPSLSSAELDEISKGQFYVHNLVCCKLIWGRDAGIGVLTDSGHRVCRTVFNLWLEGFCSARWLWLDEYLERLPCDP
jgi:hypothetical protein